MAEAGTRPQFVPESKVPGRLARSATNLARAWTHSHVGLRPLGRRIPGSDGEEVPATPVAVLGDVSMDLVPRTSSSGWPGRGVRVQKHEARHMGGLVVGRCRLLLAPARSG